jgi:hypothetical protein
MAKTESVVHLELTNAEARLVIHSIAFTLNTLTNNTGGILLAYEGLRDPEMKDAYENGLYNKIATIARAIGMRFNSYDTDS